MKIVDANVLLYAVNTRSVHHASARRWLHAALDGGEAIAFDWIVLTAFLRLSTHPTVFPRPLSVDAATGVVEGWLAHPSAVTLEPTQRHVGLLRGLLSPLGTAGNLVNDAHLAALALEHGAEIVTFDRDFGRFEGLRWSIPS